MKINKFFAAALAATTLFASCSTEDGGTVTPDGKERTVQIRIDQASSPDTRGIGAQVGAGTGVTCTSGYLLFTNTGGFVTLVVTVTNTTDPYSESAKTVGIQTLKGGGTELTAVPGASTNVYFIGNPPSGMTTPAIGNAISSYTTTVLSQYISNGGVANVTLFGGGEGLDKVTGNNAEADEYESSFTVRPISARFEIEAITGRHSLGGANTFNYRIDGIFIDKYYDDMTFVGTGSDLKSNGNTAARYVPGASGSSYTTAMSGSVYNYNASAPGVANQTTTTPGTNLAWTYNLLAPTLGTPVMPAIIIAVSNVTVNGTAWAGKHYLTIDTFFTAKGGSTPLARLAQGNIYVLDNIAFDETDLTTEPYIKTKSVQVTMSMVNWNSTDIGWEL